MSHRLLSTVPKKHSMIAHSSSHHSVPTAQFVRKRDTLSSLTPTSVIQPKLKIGPANDKYEQEADQVANQVIRMSEPAGHTLPYTNILPAAQQIQRLRPETNNEADKDSKPSVMHIYKNKIFTTQNFAHDIHSLQGTGQQLPEANRHYFESRFGYDFSHIRIHTNQHAADLTRSVNARAFTFGRNIVFGAGQYQPTNYDGQHLIAHELTHAVQQDKLASNVNPKIQRLVATNYSVIEDRLSYGIFDWVITDSDAHDVLNILNGLSVQDLTDTVAAMDRGGYLERLLDNISTGDQQRYSNLIIRINRNRSLSQRYEWVRNRLSYGIFDWAITDNDAQSALLTLRSLNAQELTLALSKMVAEGLYQRFMDNLSPGDRQQNSIFIQRITNIHRQLLPSHLSDIRYSSTRLYSFSRNDASQLYGTQAARNLIPGVAFNQRNSTYLDYPKQWIDALSPGRAIRDRFGRLKNDCGRYAEELIELARGRRPSWPPSRRISRPGMALRPAADVQPGEAYFIRPHGNAGGDEASAEEIFSPWNNHERVRKNLTSFHVATVVARDNRTAITSEVNAAFTHYTPWFAMYDGNSGFYQTYRKEYRASGHDPNLYRW